MKNLTFTFLAFLISFTLNAQTADEIVDMYFETLGGKDKFASLTATRANCTAKVQGMELPVTMVNAAPNKQRLNINFQGQELTQLCFDGEVGWGHNMMTMEAEKLDEEQTRVIAAQMDFPEPLLNYKENGYKLELQGEEEVEGTPCYILKLTRNPIMIGDKEEENVSIFYMDKDNGIVIKQTDFALVGPMKGAQVNTFFSDYQEVDGIYFAFSVIQKMNDMEVFNISINSVDINPELPEDFFAMPSEIKE